MLGPRNFLEVCAASTRVCCGVTRLRRWGGRRGAEQGDSGSSGPGAQWGPWGSPPAFPSPSPKGTAILTHHPHGQSDHHPRRRPPSGAPLPSLRPSAGERSALPPRPVPRSGGQASCGCQDHPAGGAPCPSWSLLHGTPPAGGSWPLARGSSRRQFLQLFTEDLPGPRSCVPHRPSNRGSILQSNN